MFLCYKSINLFYFSDTLENSDNILILKNSLRKIKTFHFGSKCYSSPMTEVNIHKIISTVGPNLNKFCLMDIPNNCYDVILDFIESRKSTLKELNFFSTIITDDFLESISLIKELNLTSFSLKGCNESTNVGLRKLCKSQKNIKELDISYWEGLSDESLVVISELLPNIRLLRLENQEDITKVF